MSVRGGGWPQASWALASPGNEKQEAEFLASRGVPTEFDGKGRPVLRDRRPRADVLRAYGMHDRDAGYSDPAPP